MPIGRAGERRLGLGGPLAEERLGLGESQPGVCLFGARQREVQQQRLKWREVVDDRQVLGDRLAELLQIGNPERLVVYVAGQPLDDGGPALQ